MTEKEFEEIYNYYFQDVYKFSLSLSKNKDIAEEITAETFFKAIKHIDTFREESKIKVWLFQIAKNEYYTYFRKNKNLLYIDNLEMAERIKENVNLEKDFIISDEILRINNIINSI